MRKYNSLFSRLITSHTIVVLIAVLAIGFAADTFFRLFLVEQESSRLVDNVSAVARRVVVPGESGWVIRSERSILINTLQLAGIELYELPLRLPRTCLSHRTNGTVCCGISNFSVRRPPPGSVCRNWSCTSSTESATGSCF
ncbi:hypothetical protein [Novibacillus thermophilus]|uniref:Uncharacterized protein n=1 Tax=Novibacillus thermophilus TaxID=1471761 RepID=A0A1U9K7B7_9BACL|nr:hypothetical protein [Novibacillus thermophilus]AQS55928.1 hypothetical protein B0W44_09120 [Novibacillus thermophilus]